MLCAPDIGRLIPVLLLALIAACAETPPAANSKDAAARADDYMAPELRQRVERLKTDVVARPSVDTTSALDARAQTLYAWANAMALRGDDIPWSLPQGVAQVARLDHLPRGQVPTPADLARANETITGYVHELTMRDENPDFLGQVAVVNPGPYPVTSWQTIEVRYTVGTNGLNEGAVIGLGAHGRSGIILQASQPGEEDYVTVTASRSGVSIVPDTAEGSGRRRAFNFIVEEGNLRPGDVVTFLYGDTSEGGPGARMQTSSNDFIPMELHVTFEPGGQRYTLPRFALRTEGGPVAGVRGFAPSVVGVGEPFELSVRSEDPFTNRATGPIPAFRLMLDGATFREIPAGEKAITVLRDLTFDAPGVYRFSIESEEGELAGEVNPVLVEADPVTRVYWGETHGHSGMAEGQGTSDAFFAFARDDARLDFVVHSEHDIWMDDAEWQELTANTREFLEAGRFITFLGYEWTVEQAYGGHHNVVFRTPENRRRVPQQTHPALSMLYQGLRQHHEADDVLIIPHAHQAGDWRNSDPDLERLVEIQSNHGVFEWFGHMYLRHGHHVGFVSASDDHTAHPGYGVSAGRRYGLAGVHAPARTSDAIFDAMRSLSTYASTGDRPVLQFDVNGTPMGGRAPFAEQRVVSGRIIGTSPIDELIVKKNSVEIWRQDLRTVEQSAADRQTIELSVASSSAPLEDMRDNPRGSRTWRGTIEVTGASLESVDAPGFIDVLTQDVRIDEKNPDLVHFRTWTRGNHSSLMLSLADVSADTRLSIEIEPGRERPTNFTRYRDVVQLPRWQAAFELGDMTDGRLVATQDVEGHEDSVTVRRVTRDAPLDYHFEFTDTSARHGDYYTLTVSQENDQMAWASPIWVGGYTPR